MRCFQVFPLQNRIRLIYFKFKANLYYNENYYYSLS